MANLFVPLTVVTILFCLLYYYFTKTFKYWKNKNVKGPIPVPLFGNYKQVALRQITKGMFFNALYKQYPKEKFVGLYQMTSPALLIRDLDLVKQIMVKDFEAFPDRGTYFSKLGLGENIFHSDHHTWKMLRNQFTSLFTASKLKATFNLLANCGDKWIRDIKSLTVGQLDLDVYQMIIKYTIATSMVSVFGWDIESFKDDTKWLHTFDENLNSSHISDVDLVFTGLMTKFNLTVLSKEVRHYCHQMLKACIQQPISKTTNFNVKDVLLNLRKENNIGKKMNKGKVSDVEITDDLLAGQIWVFYTAGYLNNAVTLTYALYHLACNPNVQEKLRKEIDEVLNKDDGKLTYGSLKEMKYLEMVFEETLRINPTTHGLVRSVQQDIKLEGTDLTLNKGSTVIVSPYSIHHDEQIYPEPEKFIPERFLPENVKNRHPYAFLSFGAGRRNCMGSQFARIQFGICVAKLLQKFRIETSENTYSSIKFDLHHMLMKPEEPLRLKFICRSK